MSHPLIRQVWGRGRGAPYPVDHLDRQTEWMVCQGEEAVMKTCAMGFAFAAKVIEETGVPVGLLWAAMSGSQIAEWMPRSAWRPAPELAAQADVIDSWYPDTEVGRTNWQARVETYVAWQARAEQALKNGTAFPHPQPRFPEPPHSRGTTTLYNSMHVSVPFALAGFLWYQGESDKSDKTYAVKQAGMARAWRELFGAPDVPFIFVQLQRGSSADWCSPIIRQQQLKALRITPHAGMAVLMDLDVDTHPKNKWDTGQRMALWALATVHGKDVEYSGPLYRKHTVKGNRITIEFNHADDGLMIGRKDGVKPVEVLEDGKLTCVEVSPGGKQWVQADCTIVGSTLEVSSPAVPEPKAARYGWSVAPAEPFLYNKAGLPAPQFETGEEVAQ